MELNPTVVQQVQSASAKLVAVTKYLNVTDTLATVKQYKDLEIIYGFGENRAASLEEKKLARAHTHYIGRLQSRKIPTVVSCCAVIHSLESLKHAQIINDQPFRTSCFVQVNVSGDPSKGGIKPAVLPAFLQSISDLENLQIIGLSSMGWGDFEYEKKVLEFQNLLSLRDQFLPAGLTSAGTSRDYEIALKQGIDIVRVGSDLFI